MKDLLFKDIVKWLSMDLRQEAWTTVFKNLKLETDWFYIYAILVPKNKSKEYLKHGASSINTTTFKPGYVFYADKDPQYRRWGIESNYEPFVYQCFFNNLYPTTYEVIEEFKLYFNLYFDKKSNTYISVDDYSDESQVVVITEDEIKIKTKFLRKFLASKKMYMGIQLDFFRFSNLSFKDHGLSESDYFEKSFSDYCYDITFQRSDYFNEENKRINSRLLGKKIIEGFLNFTPKLWVDEISTKEYCDYIIDEDMDSGEMKKFTCNPDKLANFFGGNSHAPQFLTPVFFRRDVLLKYYQNTNKFTVSDNLISYKGSWTLEIDNNSQDYVIVYLGDLGRSLSYEEQLYWRSFNVPPHGTISDVKFNRDFLTISTSPKSKDLIFKQKYKNMNSDWVNKFGFKLYDDLTAEDYHCLKSIRLPLIENAAEFDTLILNMTKILIDYLNEKEIAKRIVVDDNNIQGIRKLEILLESSTPKPSVNTIIFLKQLQKLRSKGSAHRKGKDYNSSLQNLGIENKTYFQSFEIILSKAIDMIDELSKIENCPTSR
jgi:hypothetical protein